MATSPCASFLAQTTTPPGARQHPVYAATLARLFGTSETSERQDPSGDQDRSPLTGGTGKPKVVGLLGGMGPMATAETFRRIILATPARTDQQHLHLIVDSDPSIPDRTDALIRGGPSPLPRLLASARRLVVAGADVICMPCNTAHVYFGAVQGEVEVPIVHMVEETASVVVDRGDRSIGLLATAGTVASGVYHQVFLRHSLQVVTPPPACQRRVSEAIALITAGRVSTGSEALLPTVAELGENGTRTLVLGCTEISLVGPELASAGTILDAMQIMVDSTVDYALGRRRLPSVSPPHPMSGSEAHVAGEM